MSLTIDNKVPLSIGNRKGLIAKVDGDSSYAAGGETLTPESLGFQRFDLLTVATKNGFVFEYDYTNEKLKILVRKIAYDVTVNPASLATDAIANTQVTVTGVTTADLLTVDPVNTLEAGILVQQAWVSAADTVQLRCQNLSAGTVDAASATWTVYAELASGALREAKAATDLSALTDAKLFAVGV